MQAEGLTKSSASSCLLFEISLYVQWELKELVKSPNSSNVDEARVWEEITSKQMVMGGDLALLDLDSICLV